MQRSILALMLLAAVAFAGCEKKSTGGEGGKPTGEPYAVTLTPPAGGKVGEAVTAKIRLIPKGEYKVNLEYPTRLTVEGPTGAAPAKRVLKAEDAVKFDKSEAVFTPKATIQAAGKHKFTATFKFSVCTAKQCELKTEKLSWVASIGK